MGILSNSENGSSSPGIALLAVFALLAFAFLINSVPLLADDAAADSSVRLLGFQLGSNSFSSVSSGGDCGVAGLPESGSFLYASSLSKEGLSASKDFKVSTADGKRSYWTDRFWYLFDKKLLLVQTDSCIVSVPFEGQEIEYSPPANKWNPKHIRLDISTRTLSTGQQVAGAAYLVEPYATENLYHEEGVEWMVPWRSIGGGYFFLTDLDGNLKVKDVQYRQVFETQTVNDQFLGATCTKMFGIYDQYAYFWVPAPASYGCS